MLKIPKIVLDTNVVISATLFRSGFLNPLRTAWHEGRIATVVCAETNEELMRVLAYSKFKLTESDLARVLALYLPFAQLHVIESQKSNRQTLPKCRDARDQIFLELAQSVNADYLVSGDEDLLCLADDQSIQNQHFRILTPTAFMNLL